MRRAWTSAQQTRADQAWPALGSGRLAVAGWRILMLSLSRRLSYTVACAAQAHEQRGSSAHFSRGAVQRDHAAQC